MRRFSSIVLVALVCAGCGQDFATVHFVNGQVTVSPGPSESLSLVDGGFTIELIGAKDSGVAASEMYLDYASACDSAMVEISCAGSFPLTVEPGQRLRIPFELHGQASSYALSANTCPVYLTFSDATRYDYSDPEPLGIHEELPIVTDY